MSKALATCTCIIVFSFLSNFVTSTQKVFCWYFYCVFLVVERSCPFDYIKLPVSTKDSTCVKISEQSLSFYEAQYACYEDQGHLLLSITGLSLDWVHHDVWVGVQFHPSYCEFTIYCYCLFYPVL